jgi:hypothetical protein
MKNLEISDAGKLFEDFMLTTDEMLHVRGGDGGEPIIMPSLPPVKI